MQLDLFEWLQFEDEWRTAHADDTQKDFPRIEWTEQEIEALHLYLLESSLCGLKRRRTKKETEDILAWVTQPLVDNV
jgi:hypothetical protein